MNSFLLIAASLVAALLATADAQTARQKTTRAKGQYTLGTITFNSNGRIREELLRSVIPLRDGERFDPAALRVGLDRVRNAYEELGYILVACTPELHPNLKKREVSVVVLINEGKLFYIRSIDVIGLDRRDVTDTLTEYNMMRGNVYNQRLAELFFKRNAPHAIVDVPPRSRIHLATDDLGTVAVTFDFRDPKHSPLTVDKSRYH
jgi:hypothetical protein